MDEQQDAPKEKPKKPSRDDKLKRKIQELEAQLKDMTQTAQRVQADFQNYQQRVERDRHTYAKYADEDIIRKLLPILDNLELALKHCRQKDDFYQGVEMIYASIRELLANEGVQPIAAKGLPFDPFRHEALMTVESELPKNTVVEEMQKGYVLYEKVIRPVKVSISKGSKED